MRMQVLNVLILLSLCIALFVIMEMILVAIHSNLLLDFSTEKKEFKEMARSLADSDKNSKTKKIEFQKEIVNFEKEKFNLVNNIWSARFQLLTFVFFGATALISWNNYSLSRDKIFVDSLSEAIEKIGNKDSLEVGIGGIYILERVSKESDKNFWTVIKILTTYVRQRRSILVLSENTKHLENSLKDTIPEDVKVALKVITSNINRSFININEYEKIDLESCDLNNISIDKANFTEAILTTTSFKKASITEGKFMESDLSNANFHKADLTKSNFYDAKLDGTDFTEAILDKVNLRGVDLSQTIGLTSQQINSAYTNKKTILPANLYHNSQVPTV